MFNLGKGGLIVGVHYSNSKPDTSFGHRNFALQTVGQDRRENIAKSKRGSIKITNSRAGNHSMHLSSPVCIMSSTEAAAARGSTPNYVVRQRCRPIHSKPSMCVLDKFAVSQVAVERRTVKYTFTGRRRPRQLRALLNYYIDRRV